MNRPLLVWPRYVSQNNRLTAWWALGQQSKNIRTTPRQMLPVRRPQCTDSAHWQGSASSEETKNSWSYNRWHKGWMNTVLLSFCSWYSCREVNFRALISSLPSTPSNLPCSLTWNITSHSMKNLAFHSLLRWKMLMLPPLTTSLIHFPLRGFGECTFWIWEWKGKIIQQIEDSSLVSSQLAATNQYYLTPRKHSFYPSSTRIDLIFVSAQRFQA